MSPAVRKFDRVFLVEDARGCGEDVFVLDEDIRAHNRDLAMKVHSKQLSPGKVVQVIIYPTGGVRGRRVYVEVGDSTWDGLPWPDDLCLSRWFPRGAHSVRCFAFAGKYPDCQADYCLIVAEESVGSVPNFSVQCQLSYHLRGNVIVARYSDEDRLGIVSVGRSDVLCVNDALDSWLSVNMPQRSLSGHGE
ncbi:hypothetical protein K474DRAFT_1713120 [Panus rudis PR-1116 ss-1]|nr:hypothetical protein K474DRAFT_1713120 [Panus rudis PR-1116 ss-1]